MKYPSPERLLLLLVLAAAAVLSVFPISEVDIFWHLAAGEWILEHGRLPTGDTFAHTLPPNTPWVSPQWLFQSISAAAWQLGGWNALILLRVVTVLALAAVLWRWGRERSIDAASTAVAVIVAILLCRFRFWYRPELLSFVLFVAQLCLYDRCARKGRWHPGALLVLQWLWGNWHSSVILGLVAGGAWLVGERPTPEAGSRLAGWTNPSTLRGRLLWLALLVVVTLANPFGWQVVAYAFTEGRKTFVAEFQAPSLLFLASTLGVAALLALPSLSEEVRRWRRPFWLLLLAAFIFQSSQMIRFVPYAILLLFPFMAAGVGAWRHRVDQWIPLPRSLVGSAASVLLLVGLGWFVAQPEWERKPLAIGLDESQFPKPAVDFILSEDLGHSIYNEFTPGGYLLWRFRPSDRRVFVFNDTRLNARILDRMTSLKSSAEWFAMLDEYSVDCVLVPLVRPHPTDSNTPYARLMTRNPAFAMVWWDDTDVVFVRKSTLSPERLESLQRRLFPGDLAVPSAPWINSEPLLKLIAENKQAAEGIRRELEAAATASPRNLTAHFTLHLMALARGDNHGALAHLRRVEELAPHSAVVETRLGVVLSRLGEFEESDTAFERSVTLASSKADAYFNWALSAFQANRRDVAKRLLGEALAIDPAHRQALSLTGRLTAPPPTGS
ncbi:hypothetical protein GC173_07680 [bacterium]|nr:hypothetical protein [bacterium]